MWPQSPEISPSTHHILPQTEFSRTKNIYILLASSLSQEIIYCNWLTYHSISTCSLWMCGLSSILLFYFKRGLHKHESNSFLYNAKTDHRKNSKINITPSGFHGNPLVPSD